MNHHQIEKEIEHLEQVVMRITANDPIPVSYWRNRVNSCLSAQLVPSQMERVKKLIDALRTLEAGVE
jgi:hypothetical protein